MLNTKYTTLLIALLCVALVAVTAYAMQPAGKTTKDDKKDPECGDSPYDVCITPTPTRDLSEIPDRDEWYGMKLHICTDDMEYAKEKLSEYPAVGEGIISCTVPYFNSLARNEGGTLTDRMPIRVDPDKYGWGVSVTLEDFKILHRSKGQFSMCRVRNDHGDLFWVGCINLAGLPESMKIQ